MNGHAEKKEIENGVVDKNNYRKRKKGLTLYT